MQFTAGLLQFCLRRITRREKIVSRSPTRYIVWCVSLNLTPESEYFIGYWCNTVVAVFYFFCYWLHGQGARSEFRLTLIVWYCCFNTICFRGGFVVLQLVLHSRSVDQFNRLHSNSSFGYCVLAAG